MAVEEPLGWYAEAFERWSKMYWAPYAEVGEPRASYLRGVARGLTLASEALRQYLDSATREDENERDDAENAGELG